MVLFSLRKINRPFRRAWCRAPPPAYGPVFVAAAGEIAKSEIISAFGPDGTATATGFRAVRPARPSSSRGRTARHRPRGSIRALSSQAPRTGAAPDRMRPANRRSIRPESEPVGTFGRRFMAGFSQLSVRGASTSSCRFRLSAGGRLSTAQEVQNWNPSDRARLFYRKRRQRGIGFLNYSRLFWPGGEPGGVSPPTASNVKRPGGAGRGAPGETPAGDGPLPAGKVTCTGCPAARQNVGNGWPLTSRR